MKLLCVVPSYWPALQFGGPIFSVHGLNKALVRKGIHVTVYTTNVGVERMVPRNRKVNRDGIKITYFSFIKYIEFIGETGWQFSWPLTKALKDNLKTFDIIYIVAVWNYPTAITAYYCRQYRKPYIITPRGALYHYTTKKKLWKKFPYYHLFAKRILTGASRIHYTTRDEWQQCHLPLGFENKAVVIPNGVDLSVFSQLSSKKRLKIRFPELKDKKIILFLGRIHPIKGFDILVRAYNILAKNRKDVHLAIVGNGKKKYNEKIRLLFRQWAISEKVTFTGVLIGKDKSEMYASSNLFVLPSYSESFGMAAVEAMSHGLPVIISDKVGIHDDVTKARAGLVIKTNVEQLTEAMTNLLDNPDLRKKMGQNGRKLVRKKFTWDKVAEQMIELYKDIITNWKTSSSAAS